MNSDISQALRAAASGLHADEAGTALIISHGTYLRRDDFARYIHAEPAISDGTLMAWIDWDAVINALDAGHLPSSGTEKQILRIAASLAAGHPVNLYDAIPGLDQRNADLVVTAVRHAAGQRPATDHPAQAEPRKTAMPAVCLDAADAEELADFLLFLSEWAATDYGQLGESLARFMGNHPYGINALLADLVRLKSMLDTPRRSTSYSQVRRPVPGHNQVPANPAMRHPCHSWRPWNVWWFTSRRPCASRR